MNEAGHLCLNPDNDYLCSSHSLMRTVWKSFQRAVEKTWLAILGEHTDYLLDGDSSPRKQILTLQELECDDELTTVLKANIRSVARLWFWTQRLPFGSQTSI